MYMLHSPRLIIAVTALIRNIIFMNYSKDCLELTLSKTTKTFPQANAIIAIKCSYFTAAGHLCITFFTLFCVNVCFRTLSSK